MAKNAFTDWDTTASNNTDVGSIGILGTNAVSNFDDALRTIMAQLRSGVDGKVVYAAKSGNYTAVLNDNNAWHRYTATATVSLTAAATLGANWHYYVQADGGTVTIDPNASETINGATTLVLQSGQAAAIICTGSAFIAVVETNQARVTACGRLTLSTGTPVPSADVTAATTLYFTPYKGNQIGLYVSAAWAIRTFAETSLSLSGYTSGKPFDIFAYDNSGTLALESVVWTDDTTRATALALQDGVLVKTGDVTRRYLGTIYTSATGQCEDSLAKRFVWNMYNRVSRPMKVIDTTDTWTYSTDTYRIARATTTNRLDFVRGLDEDAFEASVCGIALGPSATAQRFNTAIGIDSTTAFSGIPGISNNANVAYQQAVGFYRGMPGLGRHVANWIERVSVAGWTFSGDSGSDDRQSGITGSMMA